jgi:hypothetical protein
MHLVPITPVGMIKYLQQNSPMVNLACSHVCLLHSMADHACSRDESTL